MNRPCPICGCHPPSCVDAVPNKRDIAGAQMYLATCANCDAVFQPVVLESQHFAKWYDYMGHDPLNMTMSPLLKRRLNRIVKSVEHYRKKNRLLEVGCGGGLLLRAAAHHGWQVFGTEISPSCCAALGPLLGTRLYQGELRDDAFQPDSVDVVVMMEVIEHLPDPGSYLTAALRFLRPGGCLLLTTPNLRGLSGRAWGSDWRVVCDEHLNYFDQRTIRRILLDKGYGEILVATTGIDTGMYWRGLRKASRDAPCKASQAEGPRIATEQGLAATGPGGLRAMIIDLAMETTNHFLRLVSLGDTLKVEALKPSTPLVRE